MFQLNSEEITCAPTTTHVYIREMERVHSSERMHGGSGELNHIWISRGFSLSLPLSLALSRYWGAVFVRVWAKRDKRQEQKWDEYCTIEECCIYLCVGFCQLNFFSVRLFRCLESNKWWLFAICFVQTGVCNLYIYLYYTLYIVCYKIRILPAICHIYMWLVVDKKVTTEKKKEHWWRVCIRARAK